MWYDLGFGTWLVIGMQLAPKLRAELLGISQHLTVNTRWP